MKMFLNVYIFRWYFKKYILIPNFKAYNLLLKMIIPQLTQQQPKIWTKPH